MILLRFRGCNQTRLNETKRNQTKPNATKQKYSLSFVYAKPISPPSEPQYILLLICNYMYVLTGISPYWFFFSPLSLSLLENFLSLLFLPLYIHIYVHIYLCVSQGILFLSLSLSLFFLLFFLLFSPYI